MQDLRTTRTDFDGRITYLGCSRIEVGSFAPESDTVVKTLADEIREC